MNSLLVGEINSRDVGLTTPTKSISATEEEDKTAFPLDEVQQACQQWMENFFRSFNPLGVKKYKIEQLYREDVKNSQEETQAMLEVYRTLWRKTIWGPAWTGVPPEGWTKHSGSCRTLNIGALQKAIETDRFITMNDKGKWSVQTKSLLLKGLFSSKEKRLAKIASVFSKKLDELEKIPTQVNTSSPLPDNEFITAAKFISQKMKGMKGARVETTRGELSRRVIAHIARAVGKGEIKSSFLCI